MPAGSPFGSPIGRPIGRPFALPYGKGGPIGPAGPSQLLSGLSIQPDGRIDLNGWTDARASSIWLPDYQGNLTEIHSGTPAVVDSGTGRLPRFDGVDYWTTDPSGAPLPVTGEWVFEHWPGATNYFLDSFTPATQTITLSATGDYTLSVHGAGSVAIAAGTAVGTGWGTATDGSSVTINLTGAGSVTCTVTGSPDAVQLENNPFASPVIQTAGASASRDNCVINYPSSAGISDAAGTAVVEFDPVWLTDVITSIGWYSGFSRGSSYGPLAFTPRPNGPIFGGTDGSIWNSATITHNTRVMVAARWDATNSEWQVGYRLTGSDNWTWAAPANYDGSFTDLYGKVGLFERMIYPIRSGLQEVLGSALTTAEIEQRYSVANLGY